MAKLKITLLICFMAFSIGVFGQESKIFENKKGQQHLWGIIQESDLSSHTDHSKWYSDIYNEYDIPKDLSKLKNLRDYKIKVFMGTWCGDSKKLVPPFIKLMNTLGLDKNVEIIGLHVEDELYKKGPTQEEEGYAVHRVPTLIFEKDGVEKARIVEVPVTNLLTDLQQVALGVPSTPNYRVANRIMKELNSKEIKEINRKEILDFGEEHIRNPWELNTLAYIYLKSKKIDKAFYVYKLNAELFPNEAHVLYGLANCYQEMGEENLAIENYKKALEEDPDNKRSIEKLAKLYATE